MKTPVIPYAKVHESRCPYCGSLATAYQPVIRAGRCRAEGCGRRWRMEAPDPANPYGMKEPSDLDLVDDALVAMRRRMSFAKAFAVYERFHIPGVTRERFDEAWATAEGLR